MRLFGFRFFYGLWDIYVRVSVKKQFPIYDNLNAFIFLIWGYLKYEST